MLPAGTPASRHGSKQHAFAFRVVIDQVEDEGHRTVRGSSASAIGRSERMCLRRCLPRKTDADFFNVLVHRVFEIDKS
jgi:hypothetical protein